MGKLRDRLSSAASTGDSISCLAVLHRLSAMPCTRPLLESTGVGLIVGKLRKHESTAVAELASRLVKVWKTQLAEHRQQTAQKGSPKAQKGSPRGRAR